MPETVALSLTESLKNVRFPIGRQELIERHGEVLIKKDQGDMLTLEAALLLVAQTEFRSISDLVLAIGEVHKTGAGKHL